MNWNLNDLPLFITLAESKSLSHAATRLNMQTSSVSRALTRLEEKLSVRLIDRNNRHIRLTSEGIKLAEQLKPLLLAIDNAGKAINEQHLDGELNLALTHAFSREVISPALAEFSTEYPDIRLNIRTNSQTPKLFEDKLDVAIQLGTLAPSGYYAKRLATIKLVFCCSPTYLGQHPELTNADWATLQSHIRFYHAQDNYPQYFSVVDKNGKEYQITFPNASQLEDVLMIREAVMNGRGVALLPDIYCENLIEKNKLTEVLPKLVVTPNVKLCAIYSSKASQSPRINAWLSFWKKQHAPISKVMNSIRL